MMLSAFYNSISEIIEYLRDFMTYLTYAEGLKKLRWSTRGVSPFLTFISSVIVWLNGLSSRVVQYPTFPFLRIKNLWELFCLYRIS